MSLAHGENEHPHERDRMLAPAVAVVRPEEVVAHIWAEVLELDDVEVDADFFELGGDSLSALQILTRISQRFNFKVTEGELFTARTVRGLCDLLQHASHGGAAPTIRAAAEPSTEWPTTSAQRRLWILDRLIANPEVYNVPFLLRMQGDIDPEMLRRAFELVEARHDILRSHLEVRSGRPVQVLGDARPVDFPYRDLTNLPEAERRAVVMREASTDAAKPIPLDGARLYRVHVFRTGGDEIFLALNFHHVITDGWSWGVLFRDWEHAYDALCSGRTPVWQPLPIQYGDYARWENDYAASPACQAQLQYWKENLQQPIAALDLPMSRARPKTQTFRGAFIRFDVPNKLRHALDKLSRQESVTRFMIGLAAYQTVLHRYTGQDDLLIGSPVANRNRAETESLVGLFVNTLVLRTNLAGDPTFRELLERVRQTRMGAFAHQDVSLETLIEELRPPRDTSRQPFFQTAFYYQNIPIIPERFGRHPLCQQPLHNGTAMFDLRLVLEDGPFDSLWGWLEYNTDLFDAAAMQRLIGHFLTVLEAACVQPTSPISALPIVPRVERTQLLEAWNATAAPYPDSDTLPDAFTRHAYLQPNTIALWSNGFAISYGELNRRANQLAHYLQQRGLQSGELVAVSLPRTPEMIVAVLGISKAGGAYVPLDASYPADRLAFMLADSHARWLLTTADLRARFPEHTASLCLDALPDLCTAPTHEPERRHTSDSTAYVIYTSGSTGMPKGVVVRHRAAINTISWVNDQMAIGSSDTLLFVTSLSFDLSVYDIFGVLGAGGCLRIANEVELRDPATLATILRSESITLWNSAPATLQQLVPFFHRGGSPTLRLVMLSGDWIPVALPEQIQGMYPNARVISFGGATEAAIWSNWFPIERVDPMWPSIPYGKPIRNARYHVLNARLQPQPIGVPGELYIGGVCLADGYWQRPELTAERFIADPFQPNERLYRTGDLARYLPDGNLQFLGRIDQQVKVRGFRVECGEIEVALLRHPHIHSAVVQAFRDSAGAVALAAFLVADQEVTAPALTRFLRLTLPDYMIPADFVYVPQLPTTANGKLDRSALRVPVRTTLSAEVEPPEGDIEILLAVLFSEVLNTSDIGRHANFFELGGHSLKAAQLVARIDDVFGVAMPLAALFEQPTVAGLAASLQTLKPNVAVPIARQDSLSVAAPIAPIQQRFWVLDRLLADPTAYNVCDVVRVTGHLSITELETALATLVERHAVLRTLYRDETGQLIQAQGAIAFTCTDVSGLPQDERAAASQKHLDQAARQRINLTSGPILYVRVVTWSPTDHQVIATLPHIAYDEASRAIFWRDLFRLYAGQHLPPSRLRYVDFAVWENARLAGIDGERLTAAWQERLAGAAEPVTYPIVNARPAKRNTVGRTLHFELTKELQTQIEVTAQAHGTTAFTLYTAALQTLLARVAQQHDICVLTPVQVRPPGTEDVIGCFVNTLPIRTSFVGQPTFRELLARVHETMAHALTYAALPYDRIVAAARPPLGLDGQALAYVAILHDQTQLHDANGSLQWQLERVVGVGAKFDLTFGITDTTQCWLEYSTDLYSEATATRIAAEYVRLLTAAIAYPNQNFHELPILSRDAEHRIMREWSGIVHKRLATPNVVSLLEEQARRTPDKVALIVGYTTTTYAQLHAHANQLARHLQTLGVGQGSLVAVCLERSIALPIALLAVLKTGGAYVPLDPAYPSERLAFMLADTQAMVLLTQQSLCERLPKVEHTILLDQPDSAWQRLAPETVGCPATPTDAAYVIYTSGSTGRPKGVVIEHRSVIEFLHWGRSTFHSNELAGVLFSTSVCFDLSIFELFVPLAAGGAVILAQHALELATLPARDRVTLVNTVPSAANELVQRRAFPTSVCTINLAGEPLPQSLVQQLYAVTNVQRVWNLYGPTEDTTYSTGCVVKHFDTVTIGRPLPNTVAHVLDAQLQLLPPGVPGELYLGGAGLARGYLYRDDLTVAKFIHHPALNSRLYRTGDLCRWRDDGQLEYLGRIDDQVKIRGFRVELGEIENVLRHYPGVQQAIVIAANDPIAGQRLLAYVVSTVPLEHTAVREYLKRTLPDYMVPAFITVLSELPMTPNGKIDRRALPIPDAPQTTTYVAPATDAERALQTLWQDVLQLAPISVTAPFEDLGGHSLAAAALMARIERQLGHKLPLETIFHAPTIRQQAEIITQKLEVGGGVVVPLQEQGNHAPLFLIAGAGGHVFAFQQFARLLGKEFPVYGMKAIGVEGTEEPLDQIEAIASRYLTEILRVRPHGPYVLGGYSVGGLVAYELALQMQERGLDVARVIVFDTFAPGYPRQRVWPIRLAIHSRNFFKSGPRAKWHYVGERWGNIRDRLYRWVGLGHLIVPEPPGIGGLSATVLRRVWAALDRARLRYWPKKLYEGRIVVMRSDQRETWAATTLDDPHLGWNRWATKPVQAFGMPAGHMELFGDANIDLLVADIRDVLENIPRPTQSVEVAVDIVR